MSTQGYSQYPPPDPVPSLSITPWVAQSALREVIVLMVFECVALVCVGLRIYSRIMKGGRFYFNDYAIFWAIFWASALVFNSLASILQGGTGHHVEEIIALAPERLPTMAKLFLAAQFTWALANAGVKVSMIDLYIKIFGSSKRFRKISYALMALTLAYCLVVVLNAFLICRPLAYNWNPAGHPAGKCGNQRAAFLGSGIINLFLDLCVICLPMPMLWRLHMKLTLKINLSFMFGVGFLICGITIWRMVTIQNLNFQDTFYKAGNLGISSCLEPLLGIANACLPILQPVALSFTKPIYSVREYFSRLVGSSRSASTDRRSHWSPKTSYQAQPEGSGSRNFRRLYDHLFPISHPEDTTQIMTMNTVKTHEMNESTDNGITLTREVELHTEPRTVLNK